MNSEFQRIARRDKKPFFTDQCKEIEENSRMEKSRDLFNKTRDTNGTFHAKMGSIKDRNGMDLTESEDTKKKWQEYTEELYKRDLHDPDIHNGGRHNPPRLQAVLQSYSNQNSMVLAQRQDIWISGTI